jgi:hypothetical protein
MKRRQLCLGLVWAVMILSVAASSSEGGWFRWGYAQPVSWQTAPSVSNSTTTPIATATAIPAADPQVLPVSAPVVVPTYNPGVAPPAANYYSAPCPVGSSSGWSGTPRTSWDFGKYPPYYR